MPPTPALSGLFALARTVTAGSAARDAGPCACCRLTRDQHGVHLMHRFVPPGQPVPTW